MGAIKTLYNAIKASQYMTGVSFVYGEEEIHDQSQTLPMVVMVPLTGQYNNQPGYEMAGDPASEMRWGITQPIDFYMWAYSTTPNATAIDHVDATETVRQLVLSACQDQRAQYTDSNSIAYGLYYHAVSERWELMQGAFSRYGRALVVTVNFEITVPMALGQIATVNSFQLNQTVTAGP